MNLRTVFHSCYTILYSHQQYIRDLVPLPSCQHLPFFFLIIAILTGSKWYLTMVLVCIPITMSDFEHLFIYLLAICIFSLEKYLFKESPLLIFKLGFVFCFFVFFWFLNCMSSLYILEINLLSDTWFINVFSHFVGCLALCCWSLAVQKLLSLF